LGKEKAEIPLGSGGERQEGSTEKLATKIFGWGKRPNAEATDSKALPERRRKNHNAKEMKDRCNWLKPGEGKKEWGEDCKKGIWSPSSPWGGGEKRN